MKFLRRLLGLDFAAPAVNQVWRSGHSGRCMRVCAVEVLDNGTVVVDVHQWDHDTKSRTSAPQRYTAGLKAWNERLAAERRELLGQAVEVGPLRGPNRVRAATAATSTCTYPKCHCPMDAGADPNWCALGLPKGARGV